MWMRVALTGVATLALSGTAFAATGQQISVNGTGGATVPAGATNSQQQVAYDQALAAAVGDAETKARMVALALSLKLGAVQAFTEQSTDFLGYCGIGFVPAVAAAGASGSASAPTAARAPSGQLTPIPSKTKKPTPKRHKTRKKAHKAQGSENMCQLSADVTVTYSAS
jgi:uncharacterized protein DUF541